MNILSKNKIEESESRSDKERTVLYNSFMNAPAGIVILKGATHIFELANTVYEKLIGRPVAIGKTVREVLPEIEQQGLWHILDNAFATGEPFIANELPVELKKKEESVLEKHYLNLVIQPLKDEKGNVERLLAHIIDITEQVEARKKIEASEKRFSNILSQSLMPIAIFKGAEMVVEFANEPMLNVLGKGNAVLNKPLLEGGPELKDQVFPKLLADVYTTGVACEGFETKAILVSNGIPVDAYFNFVYQPYRDVDDTITGITVLATEVTEKVLAKKQIAESEAKFKMLSETIPHTIWTATPDGKKNFFNKYFLDYTGLSFEELKGDGWQKIIFPDDLERELAQWHHALKTGEDFKIEKRIRHHNGTYRWHLSHSIPQKNEEGKITGWIGTNTEIEGKKFAEELEQKVKERTYQLHIQNETFKQAEESSKQGSYSFNLTTGKLAYSDNLFRLIRYEPNEFEPSLEEFNKHVHPEDRDYVTQAAQKVLASKTAEEWQYRMNTKNGTVINIKGTGRVIESGNEKLLVGTLQDVTKEFELNKELQEKEEYRKQIINNAPDAVIVINEKSIITLWNPKTEEIFGWKAEEVLGLHLTDTIIPTQYCEAHREGMKRLLKTGEARILNNTLELTALNKEGKEFPISLTISQAAQEGNKLFIAFLRDITLEKQNKEELIVKTKQLEEINLTLDLKNKELENSNAELASFSYVASHDLQEPLRKIQTFSRRIIEAEILSDKTRDYFDRIIAAGERMQNLIVSLLDFSSTNTTELIFVPCNLNIIVEESNSDLHLSILEKQAIIEYENLPTINGVHIQLSQLFTNLIDNGIKYSRPEIKPHIKITAKRIDGNQIGHPAANQQTEYHAIKIADNGIGFEKQYETKIFELFQRLHSKNEYSGTGIGLAIVKKIVTNHNGFIGAEGKPGIGSTFTIYIPTT